MANIPLGGIHFAQDPLGDALIQGSTLSNQLVARQQALLDIQARQAELEEFMAMRPMREKKARLGIEAAERALDKAAFENRQLYRREQLSQAKSIAETKYLQSRSALQTSMAAVGGKIAQKDLFSPGDQTRTVETVAKMLETDKDIKKPWYEDNPDALDSKEEKASFAEIASWRAQEIQMQSYRSGIPMSKDDAIQKAYEELKVEYGIATEEEEEKAVASTVGMVKVRDPNGIEQFIPSEELDNALAAGWKKVE